MYLTMGENWPRKEERGFRVLFTVLRDEREQGDFIVKLRKHPWSENSQTLL